MTSLLRDRSLVVDFGGSATKMLLYEGAGLERRACFASGMYECSAAGLAQLMRDNDLVEVDRPVSRIVATGGKTGALGPALNNIPVIAVNEIQALGVGGLLCVDSGPVLVVSIGTGTAMAVAAQDASGFDVKHVGGLGLGGGTLMGLGRLLCQIETFDELNALAVEGSTEDVDLLVGDIVGSGIGVVPAEQTASNFGKLALNGGPYSKADLAAGLFTLVGQSVGRLAIVLARQADVEHTVVVGQVTENAYMREVFANMQKLFGGSFVFASDSRYRVAMGAFRIASTLDNR